MITVYEIKANGFLGVSKEIDPREGVGRNWTYTPPPAEGSHKWENGRWIAAVEPPLSIPGPDVEALAASAREERNTRLAQTDWMVTKALEQGVPVDPKVLEMRQSLRDITLQPGFPLEVQWPSIE